MQQALEYARLAIQFALDDLNDRRPPEVIAARLSKALADTQSCEIGNCLHQKCARERVARRRAEWQQVQQEKASDANY